MAEKPGGFSRATTSDNPGGGFSWRSAVIWFVALYLVAYAVIVLGSYGWLTQVSRSVVLPQGAAFSFSMSPFGVALRVPAASVNLGTDAQPIPLLMDDARHIWPLLTPWAMETHAANAKMRINGTFSHDDFTGHQVVLRAALPLRITLSAASVDWQVVLHNVKGDGQPGESGVTTLVSPVLDYRDGFYGLLGPAERITFTTSPVMLPTNQVCNAVQMDKLLIDLSATKRLPRAFDKASVQAWYDAGGQLNLNDFQLSIIDMDIIMAGDVGLTSMLDLTGNMQLQVSGIAAGYSRLGQLGIVPPQQYRLLGYVLQAMPDAGTRTFTLPVKIDKNKFFVGPAAAFALPPMPWQPQTAAAITPPTTEQLLARPVRPAKPVDDAPAPEMPAPEMAVPLGGSKEVFAPKPLDGAQDVKSTVTPKAAPSLAPGISSTTPEGTGGRTKMQLPTDASTPGAIEVPGSERLVPPPPAR